MKHSPVHQHIFIKTNNDFSLHKKKTRLMQIFFKVGKITALLAKVHIVLEQNIKVIIET